MKNSMIISTLVAVLLFASSSSYAVPAGKTSNEFEITPVENLYLGKTIEKVWMISYSEQEKPVTITLRSVGNGREYVVRSQFFEVVYAATNEGFGVRKINSSLKEVPRKMTASIINKEQMQNQRILVLRHIWGIHILMKNM